MRCCECIKAIKLLDNKEVVICSVSYKPEPAIEIVKCNDFESKYRKK
jgi:hypothetical protein